LTSHTFFYYFPLWYFITIIAGIKKLPDIETAVDVDSVCTVT